MSSNLAGILDGPARRLRDRPAVLVGDRPVRTWGALQEAVARRAGGLQAHLDVRPGDAVGLYAANAPSYLEALVAVWHAGGVVVPISSRLHAREAGQLLQASRATACLTDADHAEALHAHAPDHTTVVVLDGDDDRRIAQAEPIDVVPRDAGDDAWIFFTSGTTGRAKGARLRHANLHAMLAAQVADTGALDERDAFIHVASLSHASGLLGLAYLAAGATQVLPASGGYDTDELYGLVMAQQRASFFVPPTLMRRLVAHDAIPDKVRDHVGTIVIGAAPVRPSDMRDGIAVFGPTLWNAYGQGETPCTITALPKREAARAAAEGDDATLQSVGHARHATRVRVLREDGTETASGEVGEVCVDGPTVMAGYLDLPDATASALRDGWLRTGDLGFLDAHARLTLVDRAKDMIISGGENVYSQEVEDVLASHDTVADAAVVGIPDPEWGEVVVAFVVAQDGAAVDPVALDTRCLERIARHKRPKDYVVVEELPRNAAGKVLKPTLREQYTAKQEA